MSSESLRSSPSPQTGAGPRWYCLRTRTRQEQLAVSQLRVRAGIESYCPQLRFPRRTARGMVWVVEPVFPGYVFARFELGAARRIVEYCPGVRGIVHFGSSYPDVPEETIRALQEAIPDTTHPTTVTRIPQVGDAAVIREGPLQGLAVVIREVLPSRDRVRVLMDFLGRRVVSEVPLDAIELPAQIILPMSLRRNES